MWASLAMMGSLHNGGRSPDIIERYERDGMLLIPFHVSSALTRKHPLC